jgi:UDP-glucose 4-epimerase
MAHALITGGAGFIGSHLAEALIAQGHTVTLLDNLSTGRRENIAPLLGDKTRLVVEDVRNALVLDRWVSEADVVFHLAAMVGVNRILEQPVSTIKVNIGGTEAVLEAANRYQKKVLIASTSEVYGKGVSFPFNEDDDTLSGPTLRSRWSYAASKAIDEFLGLAYHQEFGLPVVLFRLFNTIGPRQQGQYGMVVPRFVQWALKGEPIQVYGDGQQQRCFCNVKDAVQGILALWQSPNTVGQLFNIGSQEEVSMLQLAERIKARSGSASEIRLIPYNEAYGDGFEDFRRRVPGTRKTQQTVEWEATTPLDETIDQMIAYYQQRGL